MLISLALSAKRDDIIVRKNRLLKPGEQGRHDSLPPVGRCCADRADAQAFIILKYAGIDRQHPGNLAVFSVGIGCLLYTSPAIEAREWQPSCEKADLLLIVAHPDDELLWFGGALPTYAGERGMAVQVMYMACLLYTSG